MALRPMPSSADFGVVRQRSRSIAAFVGEARAWGWPGVLASACSVSAAVAFALWRPALQAEADALTAEVDAVQSQASHDARLHAAGTATTAGAASPADRFRAAFPLSRARQDRVAMLLAACAHRSLTPQHIGMQLEAVAGIGLLRYGVQMSVAGTYAQVRGLIADALASDAALSLDSVRLHRADVRTSEVQAELSWSYYMQSATSDTGVRASPSDVSDHD